MSSRISRRRFLRHTASAGAAATFACPSLLPARSPNEQVCIAAVGVGGKGWNDLQGAAASARVVAFCDVETGENRRGGFGKAAEDWPAARRYTDWRAMLDREHRNLDGVTVSTPDHMHAPITMTAISMGLGAYTQKPLTRTIHEARQLTIAARQAGVATQMGNQHHNGQTYRTLVQIIRSGVLGKIREVHAWSNRPTWPQGIKRPPGSDPVPGTLHWDLWLGVAPERPYLADVYHPFKWRGWFDFGAGALGDMGCHIIDPVVWALELPAPTSVRYKGPEPVEEMFPEWERIHYRFPGTPHTADDTVQVIWHDGGKQPPETLAQLPAGATLPSNGTLFIGQEGTLVTPHGGKSLLALYPQEKFADYRLPEIDGRDHYQQWTDAIRGADTTTSAFDYAGPLTETVLLGTVAARFPDQELLWDAPRLEFTNCPAANQYVRQSYRKGWEVQGL